MSQDCLTQTDWLSVVRRRIHSVSKALVTLKDRPIDPEQLHDARVACRHAESVLHICRDVLPVRHVAWLRKHLRQLRHACNPARDHDVLQMWLEVQGGPATGELQKTLSHSRKSDQSKIAKFARSLLRRHRFAHHAKRACHPAIDRGEHDDGGPFMARRLLDELNQFVRALPTEASGPRQLHRLRIVGKRLRYACEFVSEVMPVTNFDSLQKLLKENQEQLGTLHDLDVRLQFLKRAANRTVLAPLLRDSADERDRLAGTWRQWWTSISLEVEIGSAVTKLLTPICKP